ILSDFGTLGRSPMLGNKHERKQVDAHVRQRGGKVFGNELRSEKHQPAGPFRGSPFGIPFTNSYAASHHAAQGENSLADANFHLFTAPRLCFGTAIVSKTPQHG